MATRRVTHRCCIIHLHTKIQKPCEKKKWKKKKKEKEEENEEDFFLKTMQ